MNDGQQRVSTEDSFHELALKEGPFRIEHLEITVQPALISDEREAVRLAQCVHKKLLLLELFGRFAICDQRIGDFAKCCLDGLLVSGERFALKSFRELVCAVYSL